MKNGFTAKSVGAQTLGEKLREAREKQKISLSELSRSLNIKKSYIESLEAGRYNKLPADVYSKGYLISLAQYLDMDFESLLALYKKERGIEKQIKKSRERKEIKTIRPSFIITPRTFRLGLVILVVFGLFFYLWYEFSGLSRPPKLYLFEPNSDKTISEETITISGQTDPEATLSINGQVLHIEPSGNFKEKIGLQKGINVLKIQAINRLGKENTLERKIMVEKKAEVAKAERKEEEPGGAKEVEGLEMIVTVKDKATWLYVKTDEKLAYSGTMLPDSRQRFFAKEKITLSSGKASATYVFFNGRDLGALKAEGDVIRDMEFTKDLVIP